MSDTKHTPGPWYAMDGSLEGFDGSWDVCGPDHCAVASVAGTAQAAKCPRDKEANARLISAAPDLLAACKSALIANRRMWGTHLNRHSKMGSLQAMLADAIAKAEGSDK